MTKLISQLRGGWQRAATRRQATRFALAARQVHGPDQLDVEEGEAVVFVTQWRISDLPAFFAHYRRLGLRQFVFFGAQAPTEALEHIKVEPGTFIIENGLRVAAPEDHVLSYLAETYGQDRWCLCVQTDQLLALEGLERIGITGLIGYMQSQGATALVAHLLNMFPKGPLGIVPQMDLRQKIDNCAYFDLNHLHRSDGANTMQSAHLPNLYSDADGAAASIFPLVFNGPAVTLQPAPNLPSGVQIADITAALKCYGEAAQIGAKAPDATLFSLAARRWNRAALLVRAGFLESSEQFVKWLKEYGA
jgi:hypothetical protein